MRDGNAYTPASNSWSLRGLIEALEEVLGKRVDVVTSNRLYWLLRHRIVKEARPGYAGVHCGKTR